MRIRCSRFRDLWRKGCLIRRKGQIVSVPRISASDCRSEAHEMYVEYVGNQVGYHGRARTALWQSSLMTCDLGYYRRHILIQHEIGVLHEVPAYAAEVD